jgi:NADP-dependent 3-hydroxy acid dehydrogenase YdfG
MTMRNGHREREVVVITGASAGVGRATARRFAARGARIGLLARGLDGLNATRIEVEALGGEALILPADVADADEVREAARLVAHTWGSIDVWINNAMVAVFSPVKEMTAGDYARVTQVTYLGAVNGTLAALAHMLPRDRGVIVQVSSALADRGVPLQSAHFAAKRALAAFSQSLRSELVGEGSHVRVSVVELPTVNTPQFDWTKNRLQRQQHPITPIYQPEVAAQAIAHAIAHDRPRVRVGTRIETVLAERWAPRFLDRYLARKTYDAQQPAQPADPRRPSNLWSPVRGDHGAHGRFNEIARPRSVRLWATVHRGLLSLATAVVAAGTWYGLRTLRRA